VARVDEAKENLEQELVRLRAEDSRISKEQQDLQILASLSAMRLDAPLIQLRSNIEQLDSCKPKAESTKDKIKSRLTELSEAVTEAASFAEGLQARADAVASSKEARALRDAVQRQIDRYKDVPELTLLNSAIGRLDILEDVFAQLDAVSNSDVRNPSEAHDRLTSLGALQKDGSDYLSGSQVTLLVAAQDSVKKAVEHKKSNALSWLESQRQSAEDSRNPQAVLDALGSPPAFLPDECGNDVKQLRALVQSRLDSDEVGRIVGAFKKIQDPAKRAECVKQLQALLGETVK